MSFLVLVGHHASVATWEYKVVYEHLSVDFIACTCHAIRCGVDQDKNPIWVFVIVMCGDIKLQRHLQFVARQSGFDGF
jgi:hypothetical protein